MTRQLTKPVRGMRVGVAEPRQLNVPPAGPAFFTDPRRRCAPTRPDSALWTSELSSQTGKAARLCRMECPLVAECKAWATENNERWGVWGGMNLTNGVVRKTRRRLAREQRKPVLTREALVDKALTSNRLFFSKLTSDQQAAVVRGGLGRGLSYTALAQRLQHPVSFLQRLADPDAPTFDDQVHELWEKDCSDTEIAVTLGSTKTSVGASRRAQGLSPNFSRGRPRKVVAA